MNTSTDPATLVAQITEVLAHIAPETHDVPLDPHLLLRDQVELDSMDHLHFAIALNERFGVDIPEADYASLRRLTDLARYIHSHLPR
jgi:acyl carrier protein